MNCENCRFWSVDKDDDERKLGDCRYNPPEIVNQISEVNYLWPKTWDVEWCGKWERR